MDEKLEQAIDEVDTLVSNALNALDALTLRLNTSNERNKALVCQINGLEARARVTDEILALYGIEINEDALAELNPSAVHKYQKDNSQQYDVLLNALKTLADPRSPVYVLAHTIIDGEKKYHYRSGDDVRIIAIATAQAALKEADALSNKISNKN